MSMLADPRGKTRASSCELTSIKTIRVRERSRDPTRGTRGISRVGAEKSPANLTATRKAGSDHCGTPDAVLSLVMATATGEGESYAVSPDESVRRPIVTPGLRASERAVPAVSWRESCPIRGGARVSLHVSCSVPRYARSTPRGASPPGPGHFDTARRLCRVHLRLAADRVGRTPRRGRVG